VTCSSAQPKILERVTAKHGSPDPVLRRKQMNGAERVRRHRANNAAVKEEMPMSTGTL
jgi:stress-induced morphogen